MKKFILLFSTLVLFSISALAQPIGPLVDIASYTISFYPVFIPTVASDGWIADCGDVYGPSISFRMGLMASSTE